MKFKQECREDPFRREIVEALNAISEQIQFQDRKLDKIMATQAELDAATAALTALTGGVATDVAQLGTDLAAIQALLQADTLDASALDAAVANAANTQASLDAAVAGVTSLVPASS